MISIFLFCATCILTSTAFNFYYGRSHLGLALWLNENRQGKLLLLIKGMEKEMQEESFQNGIVREDENL